MFEILYKLILIAGCIVVTVQARDLVHREKPRTANVMLEFMQLITMVIALALMTFAIVL